MPQRIENTVVLQHLRSAVVVVCMLCSAFACGAGLTDQDESATSNSLDKRPNIIILFVDDWGYGDLGVYGQLDDVKTPHLDALAGEGVLFTDAYVTAPQCSPSRAGLMTGQYQQRFGFDSIPDGPLPLDQPTVAEHLQRAGYVTGMVGKWHLEPNAVCLDWAREFQPEGIINKRVRVRRGLAMSYYPKARGFDQFFKGEDAPYWANFDRQSKGMSKWGEFVEREEFRVEAQTAAGLEFIERNADKAFFLYLAHFAPHVPLEAPAKFLKRFPGDMPERRRTGLAMMNAVDEGVGQIMERLREKGIADNTLIMFASDNGAPLGAHTGQSMADILPVGKPGPAWDGSRNDPLTGEKGMLAEGGIRVPMIWSWPDSLPQGQVIDTPVISLDMTASGLAAAGVDDIDELDGSNLLPWLSGAAAPPARDLYWRFWNQGAVRAGDWKYVRTGDGRELLFNVRKDKEERHNRMAQQPELGMQLKSKLRQWSSEMQPPGLPSRPLNTQELRWYDHYFQETRKSNR